MPSRFRGPLTVAPTVQGVRDVPAWLLNAYSGRTKVLYNSFSDPRDTNGSVAADTGPLTLSRLPINAGAQSLLIVTGTTTGNYWGVPVAQVSAGVDGTGCQWVQARAGQGWGSSLAGGVARNYDPPLVITFGCELVMDATAIGGSFTAIGLLDTDTAVMDAAGATTVSSGAFFHIQQTTGALVAAWLQGGVEALGTTGKVIAAGVPLRLAIRIVIRRLTAAAAPLWTADGDGQIEYYVDDVLVRTLRFFDSASGAIPTNIAPGLASARINASTAGVKIPYWFGTIGPMRTGATTV